MDLYRLRSTAYSCGHRGLQCICHCPQCAVKCFNRIDVVWMRTYDGTSNCFTQCRGGTSREVQLAISRRLDLHSIGRTACKQLVEEQTNSTGIVGMASRA